MRRKVIWVFPLVLLLAVSLALPALSDAAPDITAGCEMTAGGKTLPEKKHSALLDGDYTTYYTLKPKKSLTVSSGEEIGSVYLRIYDQPRKYLLESRSGNEWQEVTVRTDHLTEWVELPEGTKEIRLTNQDRSNFWIAEMTLFGPGEKPADIQSWNDLEKCDLMLLVAHPDDELLWFGGLLPTYAGERKLNVQVEFLVPTGGQRKLELLDALWHCGVTAYPGMLNFRDNRASSLAGQYDRWNKSIVLSRVTEAIRRYKPEVLVTQGEKGEYGHAAHKVAADSAKQCVKLAANAKKYPKSVQAYGTWQVKKLYLHEYAQNPVVMDWHLPLEAFGGKDSFEIAQEAMLMHASQAAKGWALEDHGEHDNTLFGLYFTEVGPDKEKNDFMENIDPGSEL